MSEEIRVTDANLAELARLRVDLTSLRAALEQRDRALVACHRAIEIAQADALALEQAITRYLDDGTVSPLTLNESLRVHPGASFLAELDAARAVVDAARAGFGTEENILRAHAFDPNLLTARIRAYDAAVKVREG